MADPGWKAHLTRYYMYRHLERFKHGEGAGELALSISGSQRLCHILGYSDQQIIDASYPEVDLLDLPFEDNSFNLVASDQVLEHVEGDPRSALNESIRVAKRGGTVVHTTCLINPVHYGPGDFWRFTPDGLRILLASHEAQAEILDIGGWGNRFACIAMALGLRHFAIPDGKWHPFHWLATLRDPNWLIVTWAVVRKRPADS